MQILSDLRDLTPNQRDAVLACFLGWTLDAFDFFIIVFVLKDIAKEFKADIPSVTATLFLTLAMRPVGAPFSGEHQRVSVIHHDTDNVHIHVAINKIHPKTLTLHDPIRDYKKRSELCGLLEHELGRLPRIITKGVRPEATM